MSLPFPSGRHLCKHTRVSLGSHYEYCEDCGATRVRQPLGLWHSCDLCRLPPPYNTTRSTT